MQGATFGYSASFIMDYREEVKPCHRMTFGEVLHIPSRHSPLHKSQIRAEVPETRKHVDAEITEKQRLRHRPPFRLDEKRNRHLGI